jgi:hypothetical protein
MRDMELDAAQATAALQAWRAALEAMVTRPPQYGYGPPDWAFAEVRPAAARRVRGHACYVFLFGRPLNGWPGFVLNADWAYPQLIGGASREALAAALSVATMRPASHDRKEV